MNRHLRERLLALVPERLRSNAYVAGGFAADPIGAEDVDVWILGVQGDRSELLNHMIQINRDFENGLVFKHGQESDYNVDNGPFNVVGDVLGVEGIGKRKVQILFSFAKNIQDLLKTFDITTHQIAVRLNDGETVVAPTWTPPYEQPRVVLFDRPQVTLRRLEKIAPRYGFTPAAADVTKLSELANPGFEEVPF